MTGESSNSRTRGWFLVWPAAVIAAGLALHVFDAGGLATRAQDLVLAAYERLSPRPAASDPVVKVDIDPASLAARGPWPWPRSDIARLIEELSAAGARLVVLDLSLTGPDPVSALRIADALPTTADGMALRATASFLPNPDVVLEGAFGRVPVVARIEPSPRPTPPTALLGLPVSSDPETTRYLDKVAGTLLPLDRLASRSKGLGLAIAAPEDPWSRRIPLVLDSAGAVRASLPLEAARVATGAPSLRLQAFESNKTVERWLGRPGPAQVNVGALSIPLTRQGELLLRAPSSPSAAVSAIHIFDGTAKAAVKGRVVVLDASVEGGKSGPSAAALEQILNKQFVARPFWADAGEQLVILLTGLALCLLLVSGPLLWSAVLSLAAVAGTGYISWLAFNREAWLLDPLVPGLTVLLALGLGLVARVRAERAARREAQALEAAGGYLPVPIATRLQARPAGATGGELRPGSVLACDIRGFERVLERYQANPAALTHLIGAYHEAVAETVHRNKGAIGLLRGGTIIAYWNGTVADPEHAASACNGALRLIDAIEALNERLAEETRSQALAFEPLTVSIGIESGPCLIATQPSGRSELVPVGETVALAEFLVERAPLYGPAIVVGAGAQTQASKLFALLEIDLVRTPQREQPVPVYALLGNPLVRASPKFRALEATHREIFTAYRAQNWSLARALIHECRKLPAAASQLYDLYEGRIAQFERAPPDPQWDGAHDLVAA